MTETALSSVGVCTAKVDSAVYKSTKTDEVEDLDPSYFQCIGASLAWGWLLLEVLFH